MATLPPRLLLALPVCAENVPDLLEERPRNRYVGRGRPDDHSPDVHRRSHPQSPPIPFTDPSHPPRADRWNQPTASQSQTRPIAALGLHQGLDSTRKLSPIRITFAPKALRTDSPQPPVRHAPWPRVNPGRVRAVLAFGCRTRIRTPPRRFAAKGKRCW